MGVGSDVSYETGWEAGYAEGIEAAARTAEQFYPSIIRCHKTGATEAHVRLHVETQWCMAIARAIRASGQEGSSK